jgi:histone H3/H4
MVFTDERRQEMQERLKQESENGKVAAPAIAKALGEVWKGMSEEEKDIYKQKAKERAEAAAAGTAPKRKHTCLHEVCWKHICTPRHDASHVLVDLHSSCTACCCRKSFLRSGTVASKLVSSTVSPPLYWAGSRSSAVAVSTPGYSAKHSDITHAWHASCTPPLLLTNPRNLPFCASDPHVTVVAAAAAEEAAAAGDQEQQDADAAAAGEDSTSQAVAAAIPRHIVKRIMLTDDEVQRVSADALWLVGEAGRLLLQQLAVKGAAAAAAKKRKTIKLEDFEHVVRCARFHVLAATAQKRCSL